MNKVDPDMNKALASAFAKGVKFEQDRVIQLVAAYYTELSDMLDDENDFIGKKVFRNKLELNRARTKVAQYSGAIIVISGILNALMAERDRNAKN